MQKLTWLVIANSVEAKIYHITKQEHTLVKTLTHEQGRLKSSELTADKQGAYKSGSSVHGQFAPHTDPHEEEHIVFARELAHFLEHSHQQNEYKELILCAAPHFHGLVNKALNKGVHSSIVKSIEKDYIPLPKDKLEAVIKTIIDELA